MPAHCVLDHHDGVVHHNADCQDQAKQRDQVNGVAKRRHHRKRANERHGNRNGWHQRGPPVLEEDKNHEHHQPHGLQQRGPHFRDRGVHELRGIEGDVRSDPLGESCFQFLELCFHQRRDVERIGTGKLIDQDRNAFAARIPCLDVVVFSAKVHPGDILHARKSPVVRRLDDQVLELLHVAQSAQRIDGELIGLTCRHRRLPNLTSRHLDILLADRGNHVLGREVAGLELVGVEPDPHAVVGPTEHDHFADPVEPCQFVLDVLVRVVGKKQAVVFLRLGRERQHQRDAGRTFFCHDALLGHLGRQTWFGSRHAVLHHHRRNVQIGAHLEGDGQIVRTIAGAGGLHVEHALDAVDFLLNWRANRFGNHLGIRTGIRRGYLDGGRRNLRVAGDRQHPHHHAPHQHGENSQHRGEDRPVDKESRKHDYPSLAGEGVVFPLSD